MTLQTSPVLVSVGYEGRSVDDLLRLLRDQDVTVLVDVRLNPISRKPGLSKTALSRALDAAGVAYVHHRSLGNPKDNREGYRAGAEESHARYSDLLETGEAQSALADLERLLADSTVAVMCFERDHHECHRHQVVTALSARCADLQVEFA